MALCIYKFDDDLLSVSSDSDRIVNEVRDRGELIKCCGSRVTGHASHSTLIINISARRHPVWGVCSIVIRCAQLPLNVNCQSSPSPTSSPWLNPTITSAYLFGPYAKGTARPDSDVDIVIFAPGLCQDELSEIGRVHTDLERVLNKEVYLELSPPDDFVELIRRYWVPII